MIKQLTTSDLDRILEVEARAFIPPLQASRENVLQRFNLGHIYFGEELEKVLVGTLAIRYGHFNPKDIEIFPETFYEFANSPNSKIPNALFVYSLGILPLYRRSDRTLELIHFALRFAHQKGSCYMVADGRCPSYNGSQDFPQEKIEQRQEFKIILDQAIREGSLPSKEKLLKDSTLAFYLRFAGGIPWKLISNFIPEDKPSGGNRVILYKPLR